MRRALQARNDRIGGAVQSVGFSTLPVAPHVSGTYGPKPILHTDDETVIAIWLTYLTARENGLDPVTFGREACILLVDSGTGDAL